MNFGRNCDHLFARVRVCVNFKFVHAVNVIHLIKYQSVYYRYYSMYLCGLVWNCSLIVLHHDRCTHSCSSVSEEPSDYWAISSVCIQSVCLLTVLLESIKSKVFCGDAG